MDQEQFFFNRRRFLKNISLGAAGLSLGAGSFQISDFRFQISNEASAAQVLPGLSRVSFAAGKDRRQLMVEILKPFEKEIKEGIKGKQVIIKPNCVWHDYPLCATHPDAVRGVLDFLKPIYSKKVIIGESTASPNGTMSIYEKYGYTPLEREYNAKLVDLNLDTTTIKWILGENRYPLDIRIIDTFLNPNNYIISLARMKTHDCVVATLSMKNMIMASPVNVPKNHPNFVANQSEKAKMHQGGPKGINYNMYMVAHFARPKLAIIDGVEGMEGNGPAAGTPVEHGIALAGLDAVSVDRVGLELMGIDYKDVGFLQWCSAAGLGQGDRTKIQIDGTEDLSKHIIKYKLRDNIEWQMEWKKA
jgi:uncharacterized protein (DUF362 family)